ncbi:SRPBCC family protein [Nocardioides montaniterrae]
MRAAYDFTTQWLVPAPIADVARVLDDLEHYPEWWPQVRAVASLGPTTARVLCRSALPYTLDLVLEAVSRTPPTLEVAVGGDLEGTVRWHLSAVAGGTRMLFEQHVEVGGALALASYAARPVLTWNHHRMMAGAERGLRERLSPS